MKINGYELMVVCANLDKDINCYGDIYDCVEDCLNEHPGDEIIYGYHLVGEKETPDWFGTIEEAIAWARNERTHGHPAEKSEMRMKTVWITVYKDTIRQHDEDDNLADIQVSEEIAKQYFRACKENSDCEWKTYEEFMDNFTADDTEDFYNFAKEHDAILNMFPVEGDIEIGNEYVFYHKEGNALEKYDGTECKIVSLNNDCDYFAEMCDGRKIQVYRNELSR